jgi:hypothetical protein
MGQLVLEADFVPTMRDKNTVIENAAVCVEGATSPVPHAR